MDPDLLYLSFMATIGSLAVLTPVVFVTMHPEDFEILGRCQAFRQGFNGENPGRLQTPMGGTPVGMFQGIWICTTSWISRGTMIPYPELELQAVGIGHRFEESWVNRRRTDQILDRPGPGPFARWPLTGFTRVTPPEFIRMTIETPVERPTVWEHLEEDIGSV